MEEQEPARWRRRKEARPGELLEAALDCFAERGYAATRLEDVAARHGVQKIKTIGDAFLATAGLPRPDPDPVGRLVRCGAEVIRTVAAHAAGWQVRIGIHVGPVMAGVIGATQFQFDVFGETVNLAARLQGLARPGGVVLSAAAWAAVNGCVAATPREVDVHGIGRITLWDVQATPS